MWSGVSIQVRRQFPLSSSASVPQVVLLGLRAGLRHLPDLGGLSSLGGVVDTSWRRGQRMLGLCR